MDPDLCATTYRGPIRHGNRTIADCRTVVNWRNAVVNHPDSVIGPNHPMRLWGRGGVVTFGLWPWAGGISLRTVSGQYSVKSLSMNFQGLAGPLPGELPYLQKLSLPGNILSGELPSWLYYSRNLEEIDLTNNRLSGTVGTFDAPNLAILNLSDNLFSGDLPDFEFSRMRALKNIVLSLNSFSGEIPDAWVALTASNRAIQWLDIANNNISGNLPDWVSNLKFPNTPTGRIWSTAYPNAVRMSHNRICIPNNFVIPSFRKLNNQYASVWLELEPNQCPHSTSQTSLLQRAPNIQFEAVRTSGQQLTDDPAGLKVSWSRPSGLTGPVTYRVQLYLTVDQELIVAGLRNRYFKYCTGADFGDITVGPSSEANLETTVTRSNCTAGRLDDSRTIFDPTKYVADVVVVRNNQMTAYSSSAALTNSWSVFTATDARKTFRDVANVMRLPSQSSIWVWDVANQIWVERNQDNPNFRTLNLQEGSSLAFSRRTPLSWLGPAGLSTADEDTPVQLQNGWNVISAGGAATRPAGDDGGAFFLDKNSLVNCDTSSGAIAIMRYDTASGQFDAELPCHPRAEARLTSSDSIGTIDSLEKADILFIYFRTVLPVTVHWATDKYTPQ